MQNSKQAPEEMNMIIHLTEEPAAASRRPGAGQARHAVHLQQQRFLREAENLGIQLKNIHMYKTVLNAIAATVPCGDFAKLEALADVRMVEPDGKVMAAGLPDTDKEDAENAIDPVYQEVQALWAEGIDGSGVKVAVLDSGIDPDHPDIKHAYRGGWNLVDQSDRDIYTQDRAFDDPRETSPDERAEGAPEKAAASGTRFETYHGTHIAGIIAGKHDNGVKGVAPKVDLYAFRIFGAYLSGSVSTILKGIEEAVDRKMDILNLSLSDSSDLENHALAIAVNHAILSGCVVVSTAGNTGSVRGSVRSPGTSRLGIAVGNSTITDEIDSSSSRGPSRPNFDIKPDIVAPGTEVLSTMPGYGKADAYPDAYKHETGTSQAAPYVTGVAALMKQAHPDWSPLDIKVAMTNNAKVLETGVYNVFDQGAGRIRPYEAVHTPILAYSTEEVDANGEGKIVQNRKGAITFGAVALDEDITITKHVIVKDLTGNNGIYDVTIDVTQPFRETKLTVEPASFTLHGEQLLEVTLTASKHTNPKYRDEILGYLHILNEERTTDVSLPFAADFSNGATVVPAIETFHITQKDISFADESAKEEVTLAITSDLSYPSLEITDYLTKAPIDSLFYDNGISLGSHKFPVQRHYTSSWTNEAAVLPDGIYSIDFTGMATGEPLTASIGPVFVKSTPPAITASPGGTTVSGQVTDAYVEYNKALAEIGEEFDVNEKLKASCVFTRDGEEGPAAPIKLEQDGTFSFEAAPTDAGKLSVLVKDAAGNCVTFTVEHSSY